MVLPMPIMDRLHHQAITIALETEPEPRSCPQCLAENRLILKPIQCSRQQGRHRAGPRSSKKDHHETNYHSDRQSASFSLNRREIYYSAVHLSSEPRIEHLALQLLEMLPRAEQEHRRESMQRKAMDRSHHRHVLSVAVRHTSRMHAEMT